MDGLGVFRPRWREGCRYWDSSRGHLVLVDHAPEDIVAARWYRWPGGEANQSSGTPQAFSISRARTRDGAPARVQPSTDHRVEEHRRMVRRCWSGGELTFPRPSEAVAET